MPRRRRNAAAKRLATVLGVVTGAMLLGLLIATHTVSAINPFYRHAGPARWREPVFALPEPTQPPPLAYSPIGWGPDTILRPPRAQLTPAPELDALGDLGPPLEIEDPPQPFETKPEPAPILAPTRVDAPAPAVTIRIETDTAPPSLDAANPATPD